MGEQRDDVTMRSARECKTGRLSRPCISHCRVQPSSPRQEAGQPALARYRLGWLVERWPRPEHRKPRTSRAEISNSETTPYNQRTYPGGRSEGGGRSHEGSKDASLHLGDRSGVYSLESSAAVMVRDVCGRTRRIPLLTGMPPS